MTVHTQGEAEWVDVADGRKVFAQVLDKRPSQADTPTVVFEAGAAADRSLWALVQVPTAAFARTVVYDRAGLGRSPVNPAGPTLASMAKELNQLLDHYGPGPFILVGHSAGGPITRLAASANPSRIAGLVLVDPTDEAADVLFSPKFRRGEKVATTLGVLAARAKVLRFGFGSMVRAVPQDVREDMLAEAFSVKTMQTAKVQSRTFLDDLYRWREDPPDKADVPVTVISGTKGGNGMSKQMRAAANASHEARVAAAKHGRHVLAPNSGHNVLFDDPDVIVDEIHLLAT